MKTIILTLSLVLINLTLSANTGSESEAGNKIKQVVTMPESLKQKHRAQKITVNFMVNKNGKVIEVNAKTEDAEVRRDLEKQFINLKFEGLKACVLNSVDLNFLLF